MKHISVTSTARSYPRLPYGEIARDILGANYELSLTFLGVIRAQALNKRSRGKTYAPNVLSFPLEKHSGEIYITPQVAKKEASSFRRSYTAHVGFLFIHGLLHLKGYDHGTVMERLERKYCDQYGFATKERE